VAKKKHQLTAMDKRIVVMGEAVQAYLLGLQELVQALREGKGDQHPAELTPRQFAVIESMAEAFGAATMIVLAADSARTNEREGRPSDLGMRIGVADQVTH